MTDASKDSMTPATGWFRIDNAAVERIDEVGRLAFCVYACLARFCGRDRTCFPKAETLAEMCGVKERAVWDAIKTLREAGWIIKERRNVGAYKNLSNRYTLPILTPRSKGVPADTSNPVPADTSNPVPTDSAILSVGTQEEDSTLRRLNAKKTKPASASAPPAALLQLIDGWNALPDGIVKTGARRDPPSKDALKCWSRIYRNPELREAFRDVPAILAAIPKAKFCHGQGWFSVPWLFGKNKNHELNIVKLLAGGYDNGGKQDGQSNPGPGQQHDPDNPAKW